MSLDTHERAPDAACIERSDARIDKSVRSLGSKDDILLGEIGKVLGSEIYIPSFETTCNLSIKHRIDRCTAVPVKEFSILILELLHEIVYAAGAVQRGSKVKDPFIQVGGILKIQHSLETAGHRLLHCRLAALELLLGIRISESGGDVESLHRIHREVYLEVIGVFEDAPNGI